MPTRQPVSRPAKARARGAGSTAAPQPGPQPQPSTDDPRIMLDRQIGGLFEPIPPYPPRTEREGEFYTLRDGEMFLNIGPPGQPGTPATIPKPDYLQNRLLKLLHVDPTQPRWP